MERSPVGRAQKKLHEARHRVEADANAWSRPAGRRGRRTVARHRPFINQEWKPRALRPGERGTEDSGAHKRSFGFLASLTRHPSTS